MRLLHPAAVVALLALPTLGSAQDPTRVRPDSASCVARPAAPGCRRWRDSTAAQLSVVSVVADKPRRLLNTSTATVGGTVERKELNALPTDARDPISLAYSLPNVAQATGFFGDAPRLTINGSNSLYTSYTIDGLDNNEGFLGGSRVELPLSALERLSVAANTYGADIGRSSNGVVQFETRAGKAKWGGDVFVYNRPGVPFDSRAKIIPGGNPDAFNKAQDGFRRTQAGASGGGPLVKDRTFVFGALEYTNENEDRIASTTSVPFVGRELRQIYKAFGRVDQGLGNAGSLTAKFALTSTDRAGQGSGILAPEADTRTQRIGSLSSLTHRASLANGRASQITSLQFGTFRWNFPPTRSSFTTPQVTIVADDPARPGNTITQAVVGSSNFVFDESERQLQFRTEHRRQFGERNTISAGVDVARSAFELTGSNTNPIGSYTVLNEGNITPSGGNFYTFADVPQNVRVLRYQIDARQKQVNLSQLVTSAWLEDRFTPTASLTLNAGLRWDYDDLTSRGESKPDLNNFQPRLSVNWTPTDRSVMRGGVGRYTGKFPYAIYSDAVQFGPEGNATITLDGAQAPAYLQGPRGPTLASQTSTFPPREIRRLFALGLENPYSDQVSLGFQYQLSTSFGVTVDAVATQTNNLPLSWDLNANTRGIGPNDVTTVPVSEGDTFRPVAPATGSYRRLTTSASRGEANYVGLTTALRWQPERTILLDANYTLSRARNNTEDINFNATQGNNFDAEWADAVNDRRHKMSLRAVYTGVRRLSLSTVFDVQSGTPINRIAGFCGASYCDLDGSGDTFGNGFLGNQDRFLGVGRNGERLPAATLLNVGAAYTIGPIEVRGDVFNVFNTRNVSGYANGLPGGGARTQVGRPGDALVFPSAAPARQVQFSAHYTF
ncbi:MAG: TonB-dependent receptor plug domain-containing protein [Gemmatimonadaceae bacterium]|nr:TonB-dependent receptor plug domain-containing protein [Gemmatimonadaceae bacterium]